MTQPRLTLSELLVAVLIIGLLILILVPVLAKIRVQRRRTACANNLPQIGKAMLMYCDDWDDKLPFAAGPDSRWGTTPNYQADTRPAAFGLDSKDTPGQASISASLYLLIKYEDLPPSSFLCKGDIGTTQFIPKEYGLRDKDLIDLWDFGPDPSRHCSYSYHIPYGPYPLTSSNLPGMAVVADRNPWLDAPAYPARPLDDLASFDPNASGQSLTCANAVPHEGAGQNVLYMDSHVAFEKTPTCGVESDNIYTSHNGHNIKKGIPPTRKSQPAGRLDSLLVHDPPAGDFK